MFPFEGQPAVIVSPDKGGWTGKGGQRECVSLPVATLFK